MARRRPLNSPWHRRIRREMRTYPAACHLCDEPGADVPLFSAAGPLPTHSACRREHLKETR